MKLFIVVVFILLCAEVSLSFKIAPPQEPPKRNPFSTLLLLSKNRLDDVSDYDQSCLVKQCVGAGQECSQYVECDFGFSCNIKNIQNYTGICEKTPGPGENCTTQCEQGFQCSRSICVPIPAYDISRPGQSCSGNRECYFVNGPPKPGYIHQCINGTCKFTPDGGNCTHYGVQCNVVTSFCSNSGICSPYVPQGGECEMNATASQCDGQSVCVPLTVTSLTGSCQPVFSQAPEHPCLDDYACLDGTFCGAPQGNNEYGTCTNVNQTTTMYAPCESDEQCTKTNDEICTCFEKAGNKKDAQRICIPQTEPVGYHIAESKLEVCSQACKYPNGYYNSSCILVTCYDQLCNTVSMISNFYDLGCFITDSVLPLCNYTKYN